MMRDYILDSVEPSKIHSVVNTFPFQLPEISNPCKERSLHQSFRLGQLLNNGVLTFPFFIKFVTSLVYIINLRNILMLTSEHYFDFQLPESV